MPEGIGVLTGIEGVAEQGAEADAVWDKVKQRVCEYLATQGLATVKVERAAEPPMRDPKSGKFRHVWAEKESSREGQMTDRVQESLPVTKVAT